MKEAYSSWLSPTGKNFRLSPQEYVLRVVVLGLRCSLDPKAEMISQIWHPNVTSHGFIDSIVRTMLNFHA